MDTVVRRFFTLLDTVVGRFFTLLDTAVGRFFTLLDTAVGRFLTLLDTAVGNIFTLLDTIASILRVEVVVMAVTLVTIRVIVRALFAVGVNLCTMGVIIVMRVGISVATNTTVSLGGFVQMLLTFWCVLERTIVLANLTERDKALGSLAKCAVTTWCLAE